MDARDSVELLLESLHSLGISTVPAGDSGSQAEDFRINVGNTGVQVKTRALVDLESARRLLLEAERAPNRVLIVVAERVVITAREYLLANGAGYLDLRGHLAVRTPALIIETAIEPIKRAKQARTPIAGKAGLEIATAILMSPHEPVAVRSMARSLHRSPSTVSETLRALKSDGYLDAQGTLADRRLFWLVAELWSSESALLSDAPPLQPGGRSANALQLAAADVGSPGWALTDTAAAVAYGAPLAMREGQRLDFYVPSAVVVRRAESLLGVAKSAGTARSRIAVAPVAAVTAQRVAPIGREQPWPLAHPLFVALDLAQDAGRGREILDEWTPPREWIRVW